MAGAFRLKQGGDMLSDYQGSPSDRPERQVHHYFCDRCGVRAFSKAYIEIEPFNGEFHAINLASLDNATDEELAERPFNTKMAGTTIGSRRLLKRVTCDTA